MIMDDRKQADTNADGQVCPQCGAAESGFFCRNCGALLHGEDRVLCPRCHQIVPDGEYCNQCGQGLGGLALHLRQLAMAGDDFWVTSGPATPLSGPEEAVLQPDESVALAAPELPDWLEELPVEAPAAEGEPRVYPALRPIVQERESPARNNVFLIVVVVFMLVLLLGLVFLAILLLLRTG
jgi:RNA polymerase subunit RPABC4/transcription elongation factor Spt4